MNPKSNNKDSRPPPASIRGANSDVSEKDVIYRQYKLGGNFMYYQGDKPKEEPFKVPLAKEKAEMIPLVYKYIQENQPKGFRISWAQWKVQQHQVDIVGLQLPQALVNAGLGPLVAVVRNPDFRHQKDVFAVDAALAQWQHPCPLHYNKPERCRSSDSLLTAHR